MATQSSKKYLNRLEKQLLKWKHADEVKFVRKIFAAEVDAGYIRVRIRLKNGDLLELSEYVTFHAGEIEIISYTYHWQDAYGRLKKRWDNASYHSSAQSHPFHVHDGSEQNILSSEPMTLRKILQSIEKELKRSK